MTAPSGTSDQEDHVDIPPHLIPNYDEIVTEDGAPVDSIFSEKQMRLLIEPLYNQWAGPGNARPFVAMANVGLFYRLGYAPLVPKVMVSLDVRLPQNVFLKKNSAYFVWEYGKPPDVVIEIVANTDDGEADRKLEAYQHIRVAHYAIFDPDLYIQSRPLRLFTLHGSEYQERTEYWMPDVNLGLMLWQGKHEGWQNTWLRWCNEHGAPLPTGSERVERLKA